MNVMEIKCLKAERLINQCVNDDEDEQQCSRTATITFHLYLIKYDHRTFRTCLHRACSSCKRRKHEQQWCHLGTSCHTPGKCFHICLHTWCKCESCRRCVSSHHGRNSRNSCNHPWCRRGQLAFSQEQFQQQGQKQQCQKENEKANNCLKKKRQSGEDKCWVGIANGKQNRKEWVNWANEERIIVNVVVILYTNSSIQKKKLIKTWNENETLI